MDRLSRITNSPDRADATCLARHDPLLDHCNVPRVIIHAGPGRDEERGRWRKLM